MSWSGGGDPCGMYYYKILCHFKEQLVIPIENPSKTDGTNLMFAFSMIGCKCIADTDLIGLEY